MPYVQKFYVQVFEYGPKNRMRPGQSYEADSADHARRKAGYLAEKVLGVVAFSQMVDVQAGDGEEPVLLGYYGCVPIEAREAPVLAADDPEADLAQARVA